MCKQPTKQSCEQQGSKQGGHPNVLPNTGSWIYASAAPCGGFTINRTNSRKSPTQGGGLMLLSKKFFSWAFMSRAAQGVTRSGEVWVLLRIAGRTPKMLGMEGTRRVHADDDSYNNKIDGKPTKVEGQDRSCIVVFRAHARSRT